MTPAGEDDAGEVALPVFAGEGFGGNDVGGARVPAQAHAGADPRDGFLEADAARCEAVEDNDIGAGGRGGGGVILHDGLGTVEPVKAAAARGENYQRRRAAAGRGIVFHRRGQHGGALFQRCVGGACLGHRCERECKKWRKAHQNAVSGWTWMAKVHPSPALRVQ